MLEALTRLCRGRRVVALTGAGMSTESGIPDYRGEGSARRARAPMQYRELLASDAARARYWSRSAAGWSRFSSAEPNAGHRALAELEAAGIVRGLITQNVDRLHHRAGSRRVVELHGALEEVCCLACGALEPRSVVQARLLASNPGFEAKVELLPDGDVELDPELAEHFQIVDCRACGGMLKPNVVFFGENVAPAVRDAAWALYADAEVLLVLGSSLTVFSGFRFVRKAAEDGRPIAIVNLGPTRGDPLAAIKLEARTGSVLPKLVDALRARA
ncbi:NAD-dependent protein deacetylase [Myxococcota bacterium]|nr:NAD-dependent protein deacetylase [Myxococcota bacterium]